MRRSMTGRPRPVTATVTKPRWMQIPDPDVMAKIRRRSLESNGSTESLTSLLDHDSYTSEPDIDQLVEDAKCQELTNSDMEESLKQIVNPKQKERSVSIDKLKKRSVSPGKCKSSESDLSAWEQWVIRKAKDERLKRQQLAEEKRQAKAKKMEEEKEKQRKLKKAEVVRESWLEKKKQDVHLAQKMEKANINEAKRTKEELDRQIKEKSIEKFSIWKNMKNKEEKERKQRMKEEDKKIQEHQVARKQAADYRYQLWLKQAKSRPKSAPNSYGLMAGQVVGYHDRSAYPQPSFYNPVPWQPIAVLSAKNKDAQEGKTTKKPRMKKYNWNPDKYL